MQEKLTLRDLKPLTNSQYDDCKKRALKRTNDSIGEKPTRAQFQRELGSLWTVLDIIAGLVFFPALLISSVHIISHMGSLAMTAYGNLKQGQVGTVISQADFVNIHQVMAIPLAEGSMILFLVMFGLTRRGWRRWVYFTLSVIASVFILVANLSSGLAWFEALLAPAFTIGIGLKLEHLIAQSLARRRDVDEKYIAAVAVYESATHDAATHPNYKPFLKQEIVQALIAKSKANVWLADADSPFKAAAVAREMARDSWAFDDSIQAADSWTPSEPVEGKSEAGNPFGMPARTPGDGASIPTNELSSVSGLEPSVNGHR